MAIDEQIKKNIFLHNQANPYVDATPYELDIGFPIVKYTGFYPKAGEIVLYVVPAATFKDKEQLVGYTGKSAGASVRVAKGLTMRTGSYGSQPIRDTMRKHNFGDLIITNKRIVFIGKDDNFEFAINKVSAVKKLSNETFLIQAGSKSRNLWVDSGAIVYTVGFINFAVSSLLNGVDVIAEKQKAEKDITAEQRALCAKVNREIFSLNTPQNVQTNTSKGKSTPKSKRKKTSRIPLLIAGLFAIFIIVSILNSGGNSSPAYSDAEILDLEGHPKIYSSSEESKEFYADIDNVKILTVSDYANIQRKLKNRTDDDILLYLIKNASNENYIGTVQINLFSEELCADMTAEKGIAILLDYLPSDFLDYYSQDSSYKYSNDTTTIYTYSCRLNSAGVTHHNNGNPQYSYYYALRIVHYTDVNKWVLETDYAAYGDRDLEWIEKYADPWNIDINSYTHNNT